MIFLRKVAFVALLAFTANTASASSTNISIQYEDSTKTTTIKVKGVTCGNDLKTIAGNVEKLNGVSYCRAEKPGPTTTFEVKFNPALVSDKEIYAAIEGTGGCENPNDRPYKVKK